ncbi:MAG: N-acetylneuraminate synthase family protein [Spirochaetes bacterium]|jgi:N,N'-diacetyllegionaminate synthase|nr:N-acetylneuraminate synthase family protein [Spirochaetota bacterium]
MKRISDIFPDKRVIFVAEIGINHNGNISTAKTMIDAAKMAGADAVKIQSIVPEELYSRYSFSLSRNESPLIEDLSTIDFFEKFRLSEEEHHQLFAYAHTKEIELFSTAFDIGTVDMLERMGARLYKIASSDVTNHHLIEHIASKGMPVILSTGMSSFSQIDQAVNILSEKQIDITLLHCVSLYPAPPESMNLRKIDRLKERYSLPVGISDHSVDELVLTGAFFKGISMIECHFTDSYSRECPDRDVSYDTEKFRSMVDNIVRLQKIDGTGSDSITPEESVIADLSRRSLFAASDIPAGTVLTEDLVCCKRPGRGISADNYNEILGKKLKHPVLSDMPLLYEDIDSENY